jgi:hypothetical protein
VTPKCLVFAASAERVAPACSQLASAFPLGQEAKALGMPACSSPTDSQGTVEAVAGRD